jgi:uncharacterized Fe-S radical SAM superfamily protein PflX
VAAARAGISRMAAQRVPVLVRILVLPGHVDCCHLPSLEWLAGVAGDVRVTVMDQYQPDYRVAEGVAGLGRRASKDEVVGVREAAAAADSAAGAGGLHDPGVE